MTEKWELMTNALPVEIDAWLDDHPQGAVLVVLEKDDEG